MICNNNPSREESETLPAHEKMTKDRSCGGPVFHAAYTVRLKLPVTVGAKEKSGHYLHLSLSLCPLLHASLFLFLYRAASPHLFFFFFFSAFLRKQTDLFGRLLFLSLYQERKREEGSWWTKPRNKKVIGSRYKGKFLRSLNGNLDFSTVFTSRFYDRDK